MKRLDRSIARELLKFAGLACLSVVAVYLLIDLFEELGYFTSRKVAMGTILLFYFYSLPAAVSLLYPVSMVLSVFLVYGQLARHREFGALQSAGIRPLRLFTPAVVLGLLSVLGYFAANEWVTIPFNARLTDLRRQKIERRQQASAVRKSNVYFVGEGGRVFYIRELEGDGATMRDFSVSFLGPGRRVMRRYDAREASFRDGRWQARGVVERVFLPDGSEQMSRHDSLAFADVAETPQAFAATPRPIDETPTPVLGAYISRMRRAGENVAKEEVEYHYRFAYSLIGLVVVLLGLPLSVRLRRGGVMLGLGLGLLLSFLYWGAIQTSRAYGTSHVVSPSLAAWLPNIIFGAIAVVAMVRAEA